MRTRKVWIAGAVGPDLLVLDAKTGLRIEGLLGVRISFEIAVDQPIYASLRFLNTEELVIVDQLFVKG